MQQDREELPLAPGPSQECVHPTRLTDPFALMLLHDDKWLSAFCESWKLDHYHPLKQHSTECTSLWHNVQQQDWSQRERKPPLVTSRAPRTRRHSYPQCSRFETGRRRSSSTRSRSELANCSASRTRVDRWSPSCPWGNRNFGSRMSLHPIRRKPRRNGDPALRSTRISAPSRWALSFGEVPRFWWSWQIRMPLSHAPSKQEPPWFGPSLFGQSTFGQATTRNIVGASVESLIRLGTTGKSASLWPTADSESGSTSSEVLTWFLNHAILIVSSNTALWKS